MTPTGKNDQTFANALPTDAHLSLSAARRMSPSPSRYHNRQLKSPAMDPPDAKAQLRRNVTHDFESQNIA